jgi:hypothetical protein
MPARLSRGYADTLMPPLAALPVDELALAAEAGVLDAAVVEEAPNKLSTVSWLLLAFRLSVSSCAVEFC